MRVLLVNTSEKTGGAAVATNRLMDALNNNGVKAKMLVSSKQTDAITVVALPHAWKQRLCFLWERLCILFHLHGNRHRLFEIDIANAGADITSLPEFKQADIIHLAWINQGMLSLSSIRKILKSGKPVVWTMHDLWPATAICHYPDSCQRFKGACGNCRLLPHRGGHNDLSASVWKRKKALLNHRSIAFVACSKWLGRMARESGLLQHQKVCAIPNPIDTNIFCPQDRQKARAGLSLPADKRLILFVSQRVTDERKGMDYLIEACHKLIELDQNVRQDTAIVVLGGSAEEIVDKLELPVYPMGYVSEDKKIVDIYNAADVFVTPSLSDNLPNTIMEAMACGVPCVGFDTGGIPEMIDHRKNGYVARYRDAGDLAAGIAWTLDATRHETLRHEALRKVAQQYSQQSVALRYIEVYNEAMAYKKCSL